MEVEYADGYAFFPRLYRGDRIYAMYAEEEGDGTGHLIAEAGPKGAPPRRYQTRFPGPGGFGQAVREGGRRFRRRVRRGYGVI